jgi:hypothetical protein
VVRALLQLLLWEVQSLRLTSVFPCRRMQWARTIDQSDTGNFDWMYWLLFMGSIVWLTQLSQLSKHIDPEKQTLWEMFEERRNVWVDILGANPVPQLQINAGSYDQKLIDNLTWHARMVFAPMWNMLLSGFLLNFLNITTMEELVSDADKVECTDNILGIITNVKTRDLAVMAIGVLSFTIGAVSQFKLSEVHFQDLTTGYISYFRNTHSVKLLADAVEKATRGAAVFTNMRMRVAYFANVATQCILLYLMSIFSGVDDGGESLDLIGSFIFSVLVFERFLVGFQLALFTSYINRSREFEFSESDRALQSIQQRERVEWHGTMIFYTGIFAVMQSLICLPGLLAVIPFFKEASVESSDGSGFVDCSKLALGLSAKLDRATSEEMANFSSCVGLWLVSMLCQVWLMRTHYVQYWRYQKDVIFTINNEQEDQSQKRRQGAKAQVWEMQRQMMERVTRLRSTGSDGDAAVLQSVLDHFGLAATETMNGLTPLDIRMALSTQLEFVFQTWKMVRPSSPK